MPDAGLRSGGRELCRRQPIDAIVKLGRHAPAGMCNAGKMDHLIDPFEQAGASRNLPTNPDAA